MKKFAFIIHPRGDGYHDDYRTAGKLLRSYGKMPISEYWAVKHLPGIVPQKIMNVANNRLNVVNCTPGGFFIRKDGAVAQGFLIATMTSPEMVSDITQTKGLKSALKYARERTMSAILYAQNKLGCDTIGLGAYTAPWLHGGRDAFKDARVTADLTHGDSESAAAGCVAIARAADRRGLKIGECNIAIVGASGIVGAGMARILAQEMPPQTLTLIGNTNERKLSALKNQLSNGVFAGEVHIAHAKTSDKSPVAHAHGADIVVLTTTAQGELLTTRAHTSHGDDAAADILRECKLVVDMAMPFNLGKEAYTECQEANPKLLRIDGGVMQMPGVDIGFDMYSMSGDLSVQHMTSQGVAKSFACLMETSTIALLKSQDSDLEVADKCIGDVDPGRALRIYQFSTDFGFGLAPLQCFGKPITEIHGWTIGQSGTAERHLVDRLRNVKIIGSREPVYI